MGRQDAREGQRSAGESRSRPGRVGSLERARPRGRERELWLLSWVLLTLSTTSSIPDLRAAEPLVVPPGLSTAKLDESSLLVGSLGCLACHAASDDARAASIPETAPHLTHVSSRITASHLRRYLMSPHEVKPGTRMPDLLGALPVADRAEVVEDLTHFLSSLPGGDADEALHGDSYQLKLGEALYHEVGCVACHEAFREPRRSAEPAAGSLDAVLDAARRARLGDRETESVPLGDLARKTSAVALARFLVDPLAVRPSGRMPDLGLSEREAEAIAVYLLRAQLATRGESTPEPVRGLRATYHEGDFPSCAKLTESEPKRVGTVTSFEIGGRDRNDHFGFVFTGLIRIAEPGDYTFYTASDDGSDLWIDGKRVVDNDGVHGTTEKSGVVRLDRGDHPIRVSFFEAAGGEELKVRWKGPGIEKTEIPGSVLFHLARPMRPLDSEPLVVDPARAARGRDRFETLGCASCHEIELDGKRLESRAAPAPELSVAVAVAGKGCLAEAPENGLPRYALDSRLREKLVRAVRDLAASEPLDAKERVRRSLGAHNCLACHSRDGLGGPTVDRAEHFAYAIEADMGDEGRLPPRLDGVGDKLRADWLTAVLNGEGAARPYMATRMPQFGAANIGTLAADLREADHQGLHPIPDGASPELLAAGRELVGTKGMSCITCHRYGSFDSLGIPMLDLTTITRRIESSWFRRYVVDPQTFKPGTRMPEFWPQGISVRPEILDGDTDRQIAAIWQYLDRGQSAKSPHGLKTAARELIAEDEALIYRHFIEGAGTRAIAVAYPEEAHLAFDANELRLALVWRGRFLDASKHLSGRGAGTIAPLGDDVIRLVAGAPFARLDAVDAPWPAATGRDAGYRFRGYRLDEKRRPAVYFDIEADLRVVDYPVARYDGGEVYFERTIALSAKRDGPAPADLFFRAARAARIEKIGPRSFRVDDRVTLVFDGVGEAAAFVRESAGARELLVPVRFDGDTARLVEEIRW